MERILAARLRNILVGTDSGRLEGLTRELFVLVRDQVAAERELVHVSALAAQVENLDLKTIELTLYDRRHAFHKPWNQEHHGYTSTSGKVCSCSNGNSALDGDPFRFFLQEKSSVSVISTISGRSMCHPAHNHIIFE